MKTVYQKPQVQEKRFKCSTCGLKLNTRVGLREHAKSHDPAQTASNLGYGPVTRWQMPLKQVA
ncbi:MAG: hypothetical protein LC737_11705 [Chloroflexi bacterium]|nr:hypothetical protein [Chloroflexota bacterium]